MSGLSALQPGYYANLTRYPFHNPVKGGLDWYGEGRGSNTLTGWFAVDAVTYAGSSLASVDLRFELHSEGGTPALHGAIHWQADDPTQPAGPVLPIPDTLWKPAAGSVPESGDYVYLDSDPGDWVGAGDEYLYTEDNAELSASAGGGLLSVNVGGDDWWYGKFKAMAGLTELEPGYYPSLERYPFHNPARGGLDWYGQGRGSNTLTGWFAVDDVKYTDGVLKSVDLRFELHSEGGAPALHGAVHWAVFEPAHITGTVTNTQHAGLAGVSVAAYKAGRDGDWRYIDDATTDASGTYDIGGLRTGTYRVRFIDGSGAYLSEWYEGSPDRASATERPRDGGLRDLRHRRRPRDRRPRRGQGGRHGPRRPGEHQRLRLPLGRIRRVGLRQRRHHRAQRLLRHRRPAHRRLPRRVRRLVGHLHRPVVPRQTGRRVRGRRRRHGGRHDGRHRRDPHDRRPHRRHGQEPSRGRTPRHQRQRLPGRRRGGLGLRT